MDTRYVEQSNGSWEKQLFRTVTLHDDDGRVTGEEERIVMRMPVRGEMVDGEFVEALPEPIIEEPEPSQLDRIETKLDDLLERLE